MIEKLFYAKHTHSNKSAFIFSVEFSHHETAQEYLFLEQFTKKGHRVSKRKVSREEAKVIT